MKKISVVTVVFNDVNNIEKTIQSIIEQDYPNYEYIIIDGNSNDGTLDVIKKYDKRITKLISEPDLGIYNAMNKSTKFMTGDYLVFMNAGDRFYEKSVISSVFENQNFNDSDVIYGSTNVFNEKLAKIVQPKPLQDIIYGRMIFVHQSSFLRVDLFKNYKFDEKYKINADYDLFLKLYLKGFSFHDSNKIISSYQSGGISSKVNFLNENEKLEILRRNNIATIYSLFKVIIGGTKRLIKRYLS